MPSTRFQSPLTSIIVIFICSLTAAFVTFRFLESTAAYNETGITVGGALAGFIITFIVLWRSFHTFAQELGQAETEKLREQVTNLRNQLLRQDPPPPGYRRVVNEDYKVVMHVPSDWVLGESNFMTLFAPLAHAPAGFMPNIVFHRKPAISVYRELEHNKKVEALRREFGDKEDGELNARVNQLVVEFQKHRDDPRREEEKMERILELAAENIRSAFKLIGVVERTEVSGCPAIRCLVTNPVNENVNSLATYVYVEASGNIYDVSLTAFPETIGDYSAAYNKVLGSMKFIT